MPHPLVMAQVVRRTLRRRLLRERLWNGNVEPPLRTVLTDPEHIVRWAWTMRRRSAEQVAVLVYQRPELPVVRLASRQAVARWAAGPLRQAAATGR